MKLRYLLIMLLILIPGIVNAEDIYFTNENGVALTKKEYDYLVERFAEGFPKIMNNEDYTNLVSEELINSKINTAYFEDAVMPLADGYYETGSKSIKISSSCYNASQCSIGVVVEWFKNPTVRSYDVLGAYLKDTKLLTEPRTYLESTSSTINSNEIVNQSTGFGVSIKLPTNASNIMLYQYYTVSKGGTIYQSYQHAKSSISLVNSKKYTISRSGYGGVFLFNSSVKNKYDGMGGVSISV